MESKFEKWDKIDVEYVGTISKDEIREIMYLRDKGKNSKEIATDLGLTLIIVNKAIEKNSGKVKLLEEEKKDMEKSLIQSNDSKPDSLLDIKNSDLVQLSRKLLNSIVDSSGLLYPQELTEEKIKQARLVVSFINATANSMRTKMSYFKMVGLDEKIKALQEHNENL